MKSDETRAEDDFEGEERGRLQRRFGPRATLVALWPEVTRAFDGAETPQEVLEAGAAVLSRARRRSARGRERVH